MGLQEELDYNKARELVSTLTFDTVGSFSGVLIKIVCLGC